MLRKRSRRRPVTPAEDAPGVRTPVPARGPLNGATVGVTASRRRQRLVDALRRGGAIVSWGPTVESVAVPPARLPAETAAALDAAGLDAPAGDREVEKP